MPRHTPYPVIDSDSHIGIDPAIWEQHLDAEFRHHPGRPRFTTERNGVTYLEYGRMCFPKRTPGKPYLTPSASGSGPKGAIDPHYRMTDYMEVEGIDRGLCFPGRMSFVAYCGNRELGTAIARAHNSWMQSFCQQYPENLFAIGLLNAADPAGAIVEMRRCVYELGFPAVMIGPHFVGRTAAETASCHEEHYYPIYEEAQRIGVPICIHAFGRPHIPGFEYHWPTQNAFVSDVLNFPFEGMLHFSNLCTHGVFDTFPKLKVAIFETGLGWVPLVLARARERMELFGDLTRAYAPKLAHPFEEYIQRQVWFGFEAEDPFVAPFIKATGAPNRLLFAGDYPHLDYVPGKAVEEVAERTDMTADQKRLALLDNPLECFLWDHTAARPFATLAAAH